MATNRQVKLVKTIISSSKEESRRRALNLYRSWYRGIPDMIQAYHIPKTVGDCRKKLREEFKRHAHVDDLRLIDMLLIKGRMDLDEASKYYKTPSSILNYWNNTYEKKPTDFMAKFLSGHD